ncbi:MAG: nucleotidyltransferase domain-containing protein [bacterium]|nr:nucleotidyltransferase domain-containing protein [bacterium]
MDKAEVRRTAIDHARKFLDLVREKGYEVKEAYLFGSYTGEDFRDDSDVDVAIVVTGRPETALDLQQQMMRLAARFFDLRIEPHPFGESDLAGGHPMLERIQRTGILLT